MDKQKKKKIGTNTSVDLGQWVSLKTKKLLTNTVFALSICLSVCLSLSFSLYVYLSVKKKKKKYIRYRKRK